MEKKNAWDKYPSNKREEIFAFAEAYRNFISIYMPKQKKQDLQIWMN